MKRIIALLVVTVLCLGMLASCEVVDQVKDLLGLNQQTELAVSIDEAADFLNGLYKDKNKTTMANFDVVAQIKMKGVLFTVEWTSDNANVTIEPSTKAGYATVKLPEVNTEEFNYTLTATITDPNGNSAQKSFTFTVPVLNNSGITSTPVEGVAYKLFLLQAKLGQRFYALSTTQDNANKFINTTLDPKEAVDFYVEVVDGGYKVYTTVDGVKNYVYLKVEKTTSDTGTVKYSKYIGFSTEEGTVLKYNENIGGVWTANLEGIEWGIGTYNSFTTLSVSEASYFSADANGVTQFVMQFVTSDYAETLEPDDGAENVDDATAILNQLYGLGNNESVSGSFTLTGVITELDSYGNPTIVVNGDTARPVYCYKLTDSRFEIGATIKVTALTMKNYGGKYEFMDCTLNEFTAPSGSGDSGNTDPAPTVGIITNPEVGVAYKFGLFHGNENSTVYFNGQNWNSYAWYLAYDANGIDVYLEAVEGVDGGYRLFFYNGDAKTYVVAFPRDGDTTKGTLKLDTATPDTYFTFNTEHNTLVYTSVTGEQFYLGSSGTYKSISCSAISYIGNADSYVSHLYGETTGSGDSGSGDSGDTHEHNFVEGKCECGATDPSYQPEGGDEYMSIADVLASADGTKVKFTGTVKGFYEDWSSYNNCSPYIVDAEGNQILVFRTTTHVYDGDVVTVEGTVTIYNTKPQIAQSGSVVTIVTSHAHDYSEATCTDASACKSCGIAGTQGALGHTAANAEGKCDRCGLNLSVSLVEKSLSFSDKANRTTFTSSQQVWAANGVTLTNNQGASTSAVADYSNPARFYKSSQLIVEADNMVEIEFVCNSSSYASALKAAIATSNDYTVTVSGSSVIVRFNSAVNSFTIDSLTGGQVRMNSLTVSCEG